MLMQCALSKYQLFIVLHKTIKKSQASSIKTRNYSLKPENNLSTTSFMLRGTHCSIKATSKALTESTPATPLFARSNAAALASSFARHTLRSCRNDFIRHNLSTSFPIFPRLFKKYPCKMPNHPVDKKTLTKHIYHPSREQ